jgi:hypothetical protein
MRVDVGERTGGEVFSSEISCHTSTRDKPKFIGVVMGGIL